MVAKVVGTVQPVRVAGTDLLVRVAGTGPLVKVVGTGLPTTTDLEKSGENKPDHR
jgi:hypothetical protein